MLFSREIRNYSFQLMQKKTINKLHKRRAMNKYIAYTPDSQAIGAVKRSVPV